MIHLHNGDVTAALVRRSDIPGEHIAFREILSAGPVRPGDDWLSARAHFIAGTTGEELLRVSNDLFEQDERLTAIAESGDEVVLWFEHDLFCLTNLLYLLQRLGNARLSLIWHPVPLGTLDERELHLLFDSRAAVTPAMLTTATEAWRDYTSADPTALNRWLEAGDVDFPFLRAGLMLHAARFPSVRNGLGILENRALEMIEDGAADFVKLFPRIDDDPPRFGSGDLDVMRHLRLLANRAVPLITLSEAGGNPPKAIFSLTPAGEQVMNGEADDVKINDPDQWLGGVHLTKETLWRWDERARRLIPSR